MTTEEKLQRIVQNITLLRQQRGLSIQDLAYKADMERSNMSNIEAGKTDLRLSTLIRIADAQEVSVSELTKI